MKRRLFRDLIQGTLKGKTLLRILMNNRLRKIRRTLGKYFRILKEVRPVLAPGYRFFYSRKENKRINKNKK